MMEAVRTSENLVYFNKTKRRYIPDDSKLHVQAVFDVTQLPVAFLRLEIIIAPTVRGI